MESIDQAREPSIDEQIACVAREIALRESAYPKWVKEGRMRQDAADREIARMRAVIETLKSVKGEREGAKALSESS